MTDIRLAISFFDNVKTKRLERVCGHRAITCLQRLWAYAAANRPEGILTGMDELDIEIASDWQGDPGAFFSAITPDPENPGRGSWLDPGANGSWVLHDWPEHQPWVSKTNERKAQAQRANDIKYGRIPAGSPETSETNDSRTPDRTPDRTPETNGDGPASTPPFLSLPSFKELNPGPGGPGSFEQTDLEDAETLKGLVEKVHERHPGFNINSFIGTMAKDKKYGGNHPPQVFIRVFTDMLRTDHVGDCWGLGRKVFRIHAQNVNAERHERGKPGAH